MQLGNTSVLPRAGVSFVKSMSAKKNTHEDPDNDGDTRDNVWRKTWVSEAILFNASVRRWDWNPNEILSSPVNARERMRAWDVSSAVTIHKHKVWITAEGLKHESSRERLRTLTRWCHVISFKRSMTNQCGLALCCCAKSSGLPSDRWILPIRTHHKERSRVITLSLSSFENWELGYPNKGGFLIQIRFLRRLLCRMGLIDAANGAEDKCSEQTNARNAATTHEIVYMCLIYTNDLVNFLAGEAASRPCMGGLHLPRRFFSC